MRGREGMSELLEAVERIESAVSDVESAVRDVERAVKSKTSSFWYLVGAVGFWAVSVLVENQWHSDWRYAWAYDVSKEHIHRSPHPHDCNFLASPLGKKYCEYERVISTVRWAKSTKGEPVVSYDEGKKW